MSTKSERLRSYLHGPDVLFLMEAHSGISARIVEEIGFKAIWASGLTISASLGLRDCNEASWSQVTDVVDYMSDATGIPIMLDGDTGFGNFNNARLLVRKLTARGIAAVCIEDKLFPKTNSFIGEHQPLAEIDEFCGKIKACKDSQLDPTFSVIARVEALVSGAGLTEAIHRAESYWDAGADAILMHSKQKSPDEILAFAKEWAGRGPLIVVPTTYYRVPTDVLTRAGISAIIWANHSLRASLKAMREVTARIFEDQCLGNVEATVATISEVFELVDVRELEQAEERYLPKTTRGTWSDRAAARQVG